ncbi:MAG: ABC transporter permease [Oscillospiraceae bacterium]|nr:ABC transporter permease [Oscillospiraceae bacterium]
MKTNIFSSRRTQLLLVGAIIFAIMAITRPTVFLTPLSMRAILVQVSDVGLLALAMAVVMISRGVNFSIVNLANLSAIICAMIIRALVTDVTTSLQVYLILLMCVGVCIVIGLIGGTVNSFLIANLKVPEILTTLGTMNLFLGISMIITGGRAIFGIPQEVAHIGSGNILGIPIPFIIFIAVGAIVYLIVHKTPYGSQLKLFGANRNATLYSGINNKVVIYKTYILSCVLAAFAGLMILARTNAATVDFGAPLVLNTLLIGVLSGIKPSGGVGNVINIFLAMLVIQLLNTGLTLLRISGFVREMIPALLLVSILSLEYLIQVRNERKLNRIASGKGKAA